MKRKILFILLALSLVAMISAQERGERPFRFQRPVAETITVSGTMIIAHGMPALKSGEVTYIVSGITRLVGFIDGLKEGAQVTIDGRVFSNPANETTKFLIPTTLNIGGRSYDLAMPGWGSMGGWQRPQYFRQPPQRPQQPRNQAPRMQRQRSS